MAATFKDQPWTKNEAQVVSVILYNSNSWAAPKKVLEKLDISHRKHLRSILNIHWPTGVISNNNLYKRCKTTPLSQRIEKSRWTMLGHILRGSETSPAYLALNFALDGSAKYKSRAGRHRINLFNTIKNDLKSRKIQLKRPEDITALREIASDRLKWRRLFGTQSVWDRLSY